MPLVDTLRELRSGGAENDAETRETIGASSRRGLAVASLAALTGLAFALYRRYGRRRRDGVVIEIDDVAEADA